MGGGLYDNMWNPYSNGGYGYPQSRSYRPREGVPVREGVSPQFNRAAQDQVKKVVRTIPVMDGNKAPVAPKAPVLERKASVPVKARFESKDAAATKIQAVYRGYCVRKFQPLKNLKVIKAVKGELDTFKNRFQETEQKKKLLTDSQERLRWAEGIMALLLRLDSLQGVSPEVRLIRKALSKELLMFQETIDTLSLDSVQLNEKEDSSDAPQNVEVTNAAAPEDAEVTDAAAPEDAEVTDAGIRKDGEPHISAIRKIVEAAAIRMDAELRKASVHRDADVTDPEAAEVINAAAPQEVERIHAEPESMDIEGSTTEQETDQDMVRAVREHGPELHSDNNKEYAEAPMDVENSNEQALTTSPAQEAEGETAASMDDDFVIVSPPDASVTDIRREMRSIEQDAEDMAMGAETRRDTSAVGCIVPATTALPPAYMESKSLPISELSDRALLLQVLEENRKLRDVVGKVLQWGKHQNDTIHNLTTRIEQLEQQDAAAGRKKSAQVGQKRLPLGEFDSESDEYF